MTAVRELDAVRLSPTAMVLGEGPISRTGDDDFSCVDIRRGEIWSGKLDGSVHLAARVEGTVSALCEDDAGNLIAATNTSIRHLTDGTSISLPYDLDADVRTNDARLDPAGRLIVGTMGDPVTSGSGDLWSIEAGRVRRLLNGLTISNGLCWSADASTMFHIDSPTQQVMSYHYDVETGTIGDPSVAVEIEESSGVPDGMTIDTEGGLWVALWGGAAVHRYMDGLLDTVVRVPTPFVTCPAFVGPDLSTLLITTASEPNPGASGAGDLYVADVGFSGLVPRRPSRLRVFR